MALRSQPDLQAIIVYILSANEPSVSRLSRNVCHCLCFDLQRHYLAVGTDRPFSCPTLRTTALAAQHGNEKSELAAADSAPGFLRLSVLVLDDETVIHPIKHTDNVMHVSVQTIVKTHRYCQLKCALCGFNKTARGILITNRSFN